MKTYDLEKRTLDFSIKLIQSLKKIRHTVFNDRIIRQAIDSGTSIGANYREVNGAESKRDFKHKIRISLKEVREVKYWLELLISTDPGISSELNWLHTEAKEYTLIFGKICKSCSIN
jgi:four helix bundle protein